MFSQIDVWLCGLCFSLDSGSFVDSLQTMPVKTGSAAQKRKAEKQARKRKAARKASKENILSNNAKAVAKDRARKGQASDIVWKVVAENALVQVGKLEQALTLSKKSEKNRWLRGALRARHLHA